MTRVVRIGLDVPVFRDFEYLAHDATEADVGARVLVPFGRRTAIGVLVDIVERSSIPTARLKSIVRVLRDEPRFGPDDLRLMRFASEYYHFPLGQVVMSALPQRLRSVYRAKRPQEYVLTSLGKSVDVQTLPARSTARRRLLARLQSATAALDLSGLARSERSAARDFVGRGWIEARAPTGEAHAPAGAVASAGWPLTSAQAAASDTICEALGRFNAFLLWGVTGSGKTEVYLRATARAIAHGSQVLMLVPEIALTPQLQAMVRARFPATRIASLHSGLNETERLANWVAAGSGAARIVLGTRLAVFAPMPELGLVVVDEEHDASLKQSEGFCYSARDMAVARARQRDVPVVLGSATPALETYHNACVGRYQLLELPERVNGRPPTIQCISVGRSAEDGLAPQLIDAIAERLRRREQTLIFINRRGYAPVLMCHACGWLSGCHRCSAKLVLHLPARELQCHHCGHRARVPDQCPGCGNPALEPLGQGTQRVEAALEQHFPDARILRVDRDSTRRKLAWANMRERIRERHVDILVGTQMLAKGHDFPHLALVGVLNSDGMLYSSDFRASERLYALLTQVAGRAGRGELNGEVLIQTEFPQHPLYAALREQDLAQFAQDLLAERRAAGFPPFVYQALLRAEAANVGTALEFLETARELGRALGGVDLFDPVPAAMVRLAGRERAQLLVQSASRARLHAFLTAWRDVLAAHKSSVARWLLEVDPAEL